MSGKVLRKSVWAFFVVLACAAIVVVLLSNPKSHPKVPTKVFRSTRTATLVKTVAYAIRDFENEYGGLLLASKANAQSEQANAALVRILCADTNLASVSALNSKGILFLPDSFMNESNLLDAWGRPLHIVFAPEARDSVKIGSKSIPGHFAVWSDGENGENEYGEGDDITSWK